MNEAGGARDPEPGSDRFDYLTEPRWSPRVFYEATYWLSAATAILGFSLRIRGTRHIPRRGPVLLIANHQSFMDPLLIGLAARRHLCHLARKSLFEHPSFAWVIRMLNAVPIDQEGTGIEGLRVTLQLLHAGRAVIVYPEGERTPDGTIQPFQPGITLLIKRARAPIVPVGIAGAYDAWPRWRKLPLPSPLFVPPTERTIAMVVGTPLDAGHFAHLPRKQMLDELHQEIQRVHDQAERLRRKLEH